MIKRNGQHAVSEPDIALTAGIPSDIQCQYEDNLRWLEEAEKHQLVVGSEARILYSDQQGRVEIALAFNEAIAKGDISVQRF